MIQTSVRKGELLCIPLILQNLFTYIFIGIGGIGQHERPCRDSFKGFTVSGSDSKESTLTDHLTSNGAQIFYGQRASNIIDGIDLVVYTAAIHPDNPEYACAGKIFDDDPCRSAGTNHEKLPDPHAQYPEPTEKPQQLPWLLIFCWKVVLIRQSVGGILPAIGGNLRLGHSGTFITEACEYTNSFLSFSRKSVSS